ncbi:histidine kinase [uncultured Chryseobacterium sp.]|uniref:sensor histidine kinase n=1 Tax=uncultured Chryseobacterium sp. TaxID=259322 RepID=UPI00258C2D3A|nr:histidine kinase [uncultured Chryseobacterium sp.]
MIKKTNLPFGIIISVIFSLMALSIKGTRQGDLNTAVAIATLAYNFLYGMICWTVFSLLIYHREKLGINVKSVSFGMMGVLGNALLLFMFDQLFGYFYPNSLQFHSPEVWIMYVATLVRGIVVGSLYYFINLYIALLKDSQLQQLEVEQLKRAQLEARMSSLREQLSPHFLFNTLSTLSTLSTETAVKDYVAELANVYRYALVNKEADKILLQDELDFTNAYLHIMKIRLEDALFIKIKIDKNLSAYKMIPFSLQLLVENAIKHNIASISKPLNIEIYNEEKNNIVVKNNIQEKKASLPTTGIGLANLMSRYELIYRKPIEILRTEQYFAVKLPISEK